MACKRPAICLRVEVGYLPNLGQVALRDLTVAQGLLEMMPT